MMPNQEHYQHRITKENAQNVDTQTHLIFLCLHINAILTEKGSNGAMDSLLALMLPNDIYINSNGKVCVE